MSKMDYYVWKSDDYVEIEVYYAVRKREWRVHLYKYRDATKNTTGITRPAYGYTPTPHDSFEEVPRIPKRVQAYFDSVMGKAKTILILEQFK